MHELAICQALIEQLDGIASRHARGSVSAVTLRVGPLSGVDPDLLARAFAVASAGSVAQGALLQIEDQPVRVRCRRCSCESEARPNRLTCGRCGDYHVDLVSGDELVLQRVALEGAPPPCGGNEDV